MFKIVDVLRLFRGGGLSHREIARVVNGSPTMVGARQRHPCVRRFLLKGVVFGNDGCVCSPWHPTTKTSERRYRYYIPMPDTKEQAGASGLPRLPAAELESAVLEQLRGILRSLALLGAKLDPTRDEARVTVAMTHLDAIW